MSRITKWKLEKTKLKVVFRLQFHATQIPQTGWDKLFVSFIPSDSGKATAKTTKANVRNGTCKWSDPIYETTRLLQDAKTKKYDEKLYKLVVAMGSSRSSLLGEANINLADFADASKPLSVSLPLQGSNSGSVLHVTVQLLTSKTGFREFEQQRELREKGFQKTDNPNLREDLVGRRPSEIANDHIDKMNARVRFKPEFTELPSLEEEDELNEDNTDSAVGVDGSSHTSESLYAEKHDILSANENDSLRSTISGEFSGHSLGQSIHPEKDEGSGLQPVPHGGNDWIQGWSSEYSIDNELATAYEENSRLRGCLDVAEASIQELKVEVVSLQSHADKLGAETHRLIRQLVAEIASGEELAREVTIMKSEYLKLKDDFVELAHSKQRKPVPGTEAEFLGFSSPYDQVSPARVTKGSFDCNLHVGASEKNKKLYDLHVKWQEGLMLVDEKVKEIQRRASLTYQERDMGFLHSDLEILDSIIQGLKKETMHLVSMLNAEPVQSDDLMATSPASASKSELVIPGVIKGDVTEMHLIERKLHSFGVSGHLSSELQHIDDNLAPNNLMKEKICELVRELDESKAEHENLMKKMDEMECYYEGLIQELEESQRQMLVELQNVRNEHTSCPYRINELEGQMEAIKEHVNEQLLSFAEVRHGLESQNRELEKRANSSETALRRLRLNYSIAVGQLQKDLELLSFQVLSMFETNENLARQAFPEVSQISFQEYTDEHPELPQSCLDKDDLQKLFLKEEHKTRMQALSVGAPRKTESLSSQLSHSSEKFHDKMMQNDVRIEYVGQLTIPQRVISEKDKFLYRDDLAAELNKQLPNAQLLLEGMKRSLQLQEELHQKAEADLSEMHLLNLQLEVFSHALLETLCETNDGAQLMEVKVDVLSQQLESSAKSKEILMSELQATKHDIEELRKSASNYMNECNDLITKNHMLEGKLQHISDENFLLSQKVTENEKLFTECRNYKSMYEVCVAEKDTLENFLNQESSKKSLLQGEVNSVLQELEMETFVRQDLEKTLRFVQDKLRDLWFCMISYGEQSSRLVLADKSLEQQLEENNFEATFFHLEELQRRVHEQILLLIQEKQRITEERDTSQVLLNSAESKVLSMKQKFDSDVKDMVTKLDAANAHIAKLQQELQDASNKFNLSVMEEEKYAQQNMKLSSKLVALETQLQHVTDELDQRTMAFNKLNEELKKAELAVNEYMLENEALLKSIQAGNQDSAHLASELSSLKESLRCAHDELMSEKSFKSQLQGTVTDLTCQLNKKHEQMLALNSQITELAHCRQQVSDLEYELSKVDNLLIQNEICQQAAEEEASSLRLQVTNLGIHIEAMLELLLASDVEITFIKDQFQIRMQELLHELNFFVRDNADIHSKHQDVVTQMNACLARETQSIKENSELIRDLQSLRSELEAVVNEKKELAGYVDKKNVMWAELEASKAMSAVAETKNSLQDFRHEIEIEQMRSRLVNHEEELDILRSARDELEITVLVLKSKLQELRAHEFLLQEDSDELAKLQNENRELVCRLSEQTLKTEEFKNLSIHLKELKDKADAENSQAREKREMEGPSTTAQESLRIAFIREQCETKLQELKSQLFVSKKHGEEMLMKLQDALDEVENRKKGEASQAKRNEELSKRILELENELQTVIADKREKIRAYDRMKAELECSMLSLDCCKEEKEILEASLQQCNEDKARIAGELNIMKESLENTLMENSIKLRSHDNGNPNLPSESYSSITSEHENHPELDIVNISTVSGEAKMGSLQSSDTSLLLSEDALSKDETKDSDLQHSLLPSLLEVSRQETLEKGDLLEKNMKMLVNNVHFKEHTLKSSMERLHKELERMKNENLTSLLPLEEHHSKPNFQGLQRELLQLQAANERLGNIFPLFNEFSGSGNALERVLALEIELAEALQAKKKSSIHFQSSFLKQHKDEEAVFQSFRDINELIKDMLEVKSRHSVVETELKEMQERYSQLSLQFAEVEGERQQLVMRLKNVRSPKKT